MMRDFLARFRRRRVVSGPLSTIKPWCFYLPQFHPIPENDAWWGKGFTEWDNVRAARPLFPGHDQPRRPAGNGYEDYYDLRNPSVLVRQAALARSFGIYGFVFYHYWFAGKRLLETPVADLRKNNAFKFPFFLCWANESWTRRWDGLDREVLIRQTYSEADDAAHIQFLLPIFQDPRYYKFRGRPVLMVYRSEDLPDPERTAGTWRQAARRAGFPGLYLLRVEGFQEQDPARHGFDAAVEFAPDWRCLKRRVFWREGGGWSEDRAGAHPGTRANRVFLYADVVRAMLAKPRPEYKRYPGVFASWDNAARRRKGDATIIHGADAAGFQAFVEAAGERLRREFDEDDRHLFINAWNEWGEGCCIEPDRRHGTAFLEAVQRALAVAGDKG